MPRVTPFLWFNTEAEEAATFYVSVFPDSKIETVVRYGDAGPGRKGDVMTVAFTLDGAPLTALNGGPQFRFNQAVSLVVHCRTQEEVDYYWNALSKGGEPGVCAWLTDRYGLSWQIVPDALPELLSDPDSVKASRVMGAMMTMTKIEIAKLQDAYAG